MAANTKIIKQRYEYLGDSIPDLAAEYNLSEQALEMLASEGNWVQRPLFKDDPADFESAEKYTSSLLTKSKQKIDILSVYNQLSSRPQLFALEQTILEKALAMARSLDEHEPSSANRLKLLTSILSELGSRHHLLANATKDMVKNELTVTIAQQSNDEKAAAQREAMIKALTAQGA